MSNRIDRELALPTSPAVVWQALTDPQWLAQWLADEVCLDLRPGGEAEFHIGDVVKRGWVEEVTPPELGGASAGSVGRLAFWWAAGDEPATRVELTLVPSKDGGTRVRVVEARPLELLDLVGIPLTRPGGARYHGPALVAAS
jgi:uncharacterized protein YndB with AHSA1/START domain